MFTLSISDLVSIAGLGFVTIYFCQADNLHIYIYITLDFILPFIIFYIHVFFSSAFIFLATSSYSYFLCKVDNR